MADLIRSRPGQQEEAFPLAQVFVGTGDWGWRTVLQHWPVYDGDYKIEDRAGLARRVRTRPSTRIMTFRDYNHDGLAAEFMLPVDTTGCADLRSVVIGVTRRHNRLHAFSSVANPDHPLLLQPGTWDALLSARPGASATNVELECGFRGAGNRIEIELKAAEGGIFATKVVYGCPKQAAPLHRTPL